jgi:DMSO/TMAO reductase YedYZ molybdopterin-dependent catalytic subunit
MVFDILSRRDKDREKWGDRLPPGQKEARDWPVLTYGGVPRIKLEDWRFRIFGLVEQEVEWDWEQMTSLARTKVHTDIHCVTTWSKFDTNFEGLAIKDLMSHVKLKPEAKAVMAHCYGGYTSNLTMDDFLHEGNLLAYVYEDKPLPAEHGGPCRLFVPHLYFWKSAKWVNALEFIPRDEPGFWERYGYHMRGDPFKEERYS